MRIMRKTRKTKRDMLSAILLTAVWAAAFATMTALAFVIIYILISGIPHIKPNLFEWNYDSENVSLMPALINTLEMTVLALALACPAGIGAAVYLGEYAKRGNRLAGVIRVAAETLSGIPSIVFGLFGALFFVKYLKTGLSLLSGALTLSIMILPLIMRSTEEALLAAPDSYREGSLALGAGMLGTVIRVVLPAAVPGILSGMILATGRMIGESAALIFTAGTAAKAAGLFDSARTLAVHLYVISGEGLYMEQACAAAVVLLALVVLINALSGAIAKKLKMGKGE